MTQDGQSRQALQSELERLRSRLSERNRREGNPAALDPDRLRHFSRALMNSMRVPIYVVEPASFRIVDTRLGGHSVKVLVDEGTEIPADGARIAMRPDNTRLYADGWMVGAGRDAGPLDTGRGDAA